MLVKSLYHSTEELSNQAKKEVIPKGMTLDVGYDLSSRLVSKQVLSAQQSLTTVFGMGTGGPSALE